MQKPTTLLLAAGLLVAMPCAVMTHQAAGVPGVIATFERLFEVNGAFTNHGTGTLYLTPEHVGLWRRDLRRTLPTGVEVHDSEIRTVTERITISHNLRTAIRGPLYGATWVAPSLLPLIRVSPPADHSHDAGHLHAADHSHDADHVNGASSIDWQRTQGSMTVGPMLLTPIVQHTDDGHVIARWYDQESGTVAHRDTFNPDGSVFRQRLVSAERTIFPPDTFEVPAGYSVATVPSLER